MLTQEGNTRNQILITWMKNACADAGVSVRRERVYQPYVAGTSGSFYTECDQKTEEYYENKNAKMEYEGFLTQNPGFATTAIHAEQEPEKWTSRCVVPGIVTSSTFQQPGPAEPFGLAIRRTAGRPPSVCAVETVARDVHRDYLMITKVKYIDEMAREGNTQNQIQIILMRNPFIGAGVSLRTERVYTNYMSLAPRIVSTLSVIKKPMEIMKKRTQRYEL
ncbi:unnamed protein product [Arctia plantaginis]|uniref:Uncharacterized protein n=1 Tax=Arctia plantaginis TaxID=874455 RepID=A0A8S1B8A7_ARCPL|nr:unnamed protein product [Arctia plantaginis]